MDKMQKMDKIHVVRFLLDEISAEQALFQKYEAEKKMAKEYATKEISWYQNLWSRWGDNRTPQKSRILANSIKIRQLMREIAKEYEP